MYKIDVQNTLDGSILMTGSTPDIDWLTGTLGINKKIAWCQEEVKYV